MSKAKETLGLLAFLAVLAAVIFFIARGMTTNVVDAQSVVGTQSCASCARTMERGTIADVAHGNTEGTSYWHAGDERRAVVCFRCPQCGALRAFAP